MFSMEGSTLGTMELRGITYDGSQDEINIDADSPFYYGQYFFVGGVRYELYSVTSTERKYRAKR